MRLGDLLHESTIKIDLESHNKQGVIEELVDLLINSHEVPLSMRPHVLEILKEREAEASTGLEYGIAVPHGLSDRIDDTIIALGISNEGIPFNSMDGISARLILLILFPRRSFQGNVQTMAGIAHLLKNAKMREAVRASKTPADVLRLIREAESQDTFYEHLKK